MFILFENQAAACWKRRALSLTFAAALASACGGDDGGKTPDDKPDAAVSAGDGAVTAPPMDAGKDGATNPPPTPDATVDAGGDAASGDAASGDAGIADPSTPGTDAPELAKLGYFKADDVSGARILLSGRDQNGDVAAYTIKFFKGTDPVMIYVKGDSFPAASELTIDMLHQDPGSAAFFFKFEPSLDFTNNVDNIKVTVQDSGGRASAEVAATLGVPKPASSTCDPQGFDRCSGSNVCTPAASGKTFACMGLTSARTTACGASVLTLSPPMVTSVTSSLSSTSLWDTPAGCQSMDEKLNPDRVVKLHLAAAATKVTLSTDNDVTGFDTSIYLLTRCIDSPPACTVQPCPICEDDTATNAKTVLVLNNLAAGDYYIVVDSRPSVGASTAFELTVALN